MYKNSYVIFKILDFVIIFVRTLLLIHKILF